MLFANETFAQQKKPRIGIAGIGMFASSSLWRLPGIRPVTDENQAPDNNPYRRRSEIAIIKTGSVYVVVGTSSPTPNLEGTGIDPSKMDIVIVKQGYLVNQWYNMQADWVMAQTRGGVDQDVNNIPYKNIIRPMFPLGPDMPDPELNVILVPSAKYLYGR